jgi:bacterioferritin
MADHNVLSDGNEGERNEIIEMLKKAYWMEIETVMSYVANSVNPDGVRAAEIKESLAADIQEELGHAQQFAARIKELYGTVPGSMDFKAEQDFLQPPETATDIPAVIRGVIEAEKGAIDFYSELIDKASEIVRDEQGHMREFEGFLREYEAEGRA